MDGIIRFGPGGFGESFAALGYKKNTDTAEYLGRFGLTHFEYECGQGVRISNASAAALGKVLRDSGITVSLHSPYFISLSSADEEKRLGSVRYIAESARAVLALGGRRIVIHCGGTAGMTREKALSLAIETLSLARQKVIADGFGDVIFCPETMGKINQLGDLDEVIEICKSDDTYIPCIDFGHLYARTFGGIKEKTDFAAILDKLEAGLGLERMRSFHCHFSKIEYTAKGGEKRHVTFDNTVWGPPFEPFIELLRERGLTPVIVCESAGTQTEDAAAMMKYYESLA
ncbi:MAG: TIM barrel protein [Ruminococcus sp.]|jgi:deoxyribonuclease-4|nr:TIM barrel protein [Ruminococcus sp.]